MKKWFQYKDGLTVGGTGSENGVILADEEFNGGCRITLEACGRYRAITCGVYGAMVHTVFCSPEEASTVYENMKKDLGAFMSRDTTEDLVSGPTEQRIITATVKVQRSIMQSLAMRFAK